MEIFKAFVVGVVQGITEFLPISSSGHIIIVSELLDLKLKDSVYFALVIHLATTMATILVFRKEIRQILTRQNFKDIFKGNILSYILLSMIPIFIVGVFFSSTIESIFNSSLLNVGISLIFTSAFLLFGQLYKNTKSTKLNFKNSFLIGLAQVVALVPGISRSGTTLSASLVAGINKNEIALFIFLMPIIPILGGSLLQTIEYADTQSVDSIYVLLSGFIGAFVAGLVACSAMIKFIKNKALYGFVFYTFVVGVLLIGFNL